MRRTTSLLAAGLVAATAIAATPSQERRPAPVSHEVELTTGDDVVVEGDPSRFGTSLVNLTNDDGSYGCEGTPEQQCEVVLVKAVNPFDEADAQKGRDRNNLDIALEFGTFGATGVGVTDMAIAVYESDEDGSRGEIVGTADVNPPDSHEQMTVVVTSTADEDTFWYRVELIYGFHGGGYTATFTLA